MRRIGAIVLLAVLLAGCGSAPKIARSPVPTTLAGPLGYRPASPQGQATGPLASRDTVSATPDPAAPPEPKGQCDAPSLAYLVGRPRTDIPVPADLSRRRVACTTCPASDDYRPDRTDILFNANTGIITAVKCG